MIKLDFFPGQRCAVTTTAATATTDTTDALVTTAVTATTPGEAAAAMDMAVTDTIVAKQQQRQLKR